MYSPWIGQVWNRVPTDPWGKYVNLGADFASWTSHAISTPGNTCIGCHRIGDQNSCKIYVPLAAGLLPPPKGSNPLASSYPLTHWMPIDNNRSRDEWNAANVKSVSDLLECCSARGKNDPKCSFTPAAQAASRRPPGGGKSCPFSLLRPSLKVMHVAQHHPRALRPVARIGFEVRVEHQMILRREAIHGPGPIANTASRVPGTSCPFAFMSVVWRSQ